MFEHVLKASQGLDIFGYFLGKLGSGKLFATQKWESNGTSGFVMPDT